MSDYQKKGFLTEDYRLFHLRSDQGARTEFHYHEFCKILMLVSGSGGYTVDGRRYALQSGDMANEKCAEITANMTYLELSTYPGYMDSFVAACFIPHTDRNLFPSSVQEG